MTPRSVALGNTAAALGPGKHEVAVTGGFSWQTQTVAPTVEERNNATITTYSTSSGVQLPTAEANVQFGLTRLFGLNLHISPAGVQPGLKMTLLERAVVIGLLPELGFGWANGATQPTVFNNQTVVPTDPTWSSNVILNAGARVLFFHPGSGAYGGLGYQYQAFTYRQSQGTGTNAAVTSTTDSLHNILAAVGYELRSGSLRIRPELAVAITPERSTSVSINNEAALSRSGGNAFFLFPNVTFAIEGQPGARAEGEEEEDEERERRREDGDGDEGEEDELDENARVKKKEKKEKKAAPPPEEETPPTRRKTSTIKSEDDEEKKAKDEEEKSDSDSESSD